VAQLGKGIAIVDSELANRSQVLELLGAFATLALLLAALGIYGVLTYAVSLRKREFGLRKAIGASQWDIVCTILGYSARLTAAGMTLGIAASIAATRTLSRLLFGVSPLDPDLHGGFRPARLRRNARILHAHSKGRKCRSGGSIAGRLAPLLRSQQPASVALGRGRGGQQTRGGW
jgi:ABC-type antimicrobial peptide transport system permease subunit